MTLDRRTLPSGALAVTVHGPAGVLDLLVPADASADAVAWEYAAWCRLTFVPTLHTCRGRRLEPGESLAEVGVSSGEVLVAAGSVRAADGQPADSGARIRSWRSATPGPLSLVWCAVAVAAAAIACWFGAHTEGPEHDLTVLLLAGTAVLGVLPVGGHAPHRAVAAPAFAAARSRRRGRRCARGSP